MAEQTTTFLTWTVTHKLEQSTRGNLVESNRTQPIDVSSDTGVEAPRVVLFCQCPTSFRGITRTTSSPHDVEETFDMVVAVVFLNVLYLISAPTNILSMVVFAKLGLKERINLCLFSQSLADLIYMTENFLLYADRVYLEITGGARRGPLFQFMLNNHLVGFYGFNWASGFMATWIACERCLCVVRPLRYHKMLKTRSMLLIIVVAFVLIVGGFFVVGTRWSIACVFDPRTNTSSPEIYPSEFYRLNKEFIDALDGYVYGIALPGSFILLVSIATIITVVRLRRKASRCRETPHGTSRPIRSAAAMSVRDVALTRMLIGCSVLFVVCNIPLAVFRLLILCEPEVSLGGRHHNTFTFMVSVTELCGYINSSCNFFIYYSMGTRYRQMVRSLCGRTCSK